MNFALVNDLEQSRLIDGDTGIGTEQQCVKLFATPNEALTYAANLVRKNTKGLIEEGDDDATVLEEFQSSIGGMEWFHILPVVE